MELTIDDCIELLGEIARGEHEGHEMQVCRDVLESNGLPVEDNEA